MKRLSRPPAVLMTLCLLAGLLSGCQLTNRTEESEPPLPTPVTTEAPGPTEEPVNESLMAACSQLSGRYSPFTAESEGDRQVVSMTQLGLLTLERGGAIVKNAIAGETVDWGGTAYRYTGPASLEVFGNQDDSTTVTIRLRDDLRFSDGTPVDIDDLIFTYYVYLDPSYTGPVSLDTSAIAGLRDYRTGTPSVLYDEYAAVFDKVYSGDGDNDDDGDDEESDDGESVQADEVQAAIRQAWIESVQGIVDHCAANYMSYAKAYTGYTPEEIRADERLRVMFGMYMWSVADFDDAGNLVGTVTGTTWDLQDSFPSVEDFYNEYYEAYAGDPVSYWSIEVGEGTDVISSARNTLVAKWAAEDPNYTGPVHAVKGLVRLDDFSLELTVTAFTEADLYTLCGLDIVPLHYYGDEALYDYEADAFGFPYGDVSAVLAQNIPLGAGPYRFVEDGGTELLFEASEHYWRGEPKTPSVRFVRADEGERLEELTAGTLDLAVLSGSAEVNKVVEMGLSSAQPSSVYHFETAYPGYGYIGINADTVSVGGEPDSDASKNLRRALMTIFTVYRAAAVRDYFHFAAYVTDMPLCAASWAALDVPEAEAGPHFVFDLDREGNALTAVPQAVYAAEAMEAAIEYLKAAGFVWDETLAHFTEAPEGAKLRYEVMLQGYGVGDHPCYAIFSNAATALSAIGITLQISDVEDSRALLSRMKAGQQEIWAAAWDCGTDPDLAGMFGSESIPAHGGAAGRNFFALADEEMDTLIAEIGRESDLAARRLLVRQAFGLVYDWACELTVYQRTNQLCVNGARVDVRSVVADPTPWYSWMQEIERIKLT